ncbi:tRNA (guanosine(37)-N1)-methyltransferase TrmD [Arcanobacterium bovis]|uniref:tRNA (guanine-N(1)-)-methyltransferase n=1 Tax=Arcanobacterium bovis TaxID=2529275 RepID=A0A4Q9UZ88_9ACTO|nr:tRNA (guanosine(37)-N1)-methyltransferase TrmD [Arcanobacterium bovis]TBW20981.1 tRNA (guanosine(37)-N1)-methyltransferase TrmD [Arcanobacterium bovis]
MHFDIISAFPEFFDVLQLSLVGKAQQRGIISTEIHDIRDWTQDIHRTVDDSPFGGGAGMVMKPDVWAQAIDAAIDKISAPTVLAIPTPSGIPLTQRHCERLANVEHIILACGRYEGIDSRIAQYYSARADVEVFEFSLGDYVLNGGEVASVALVEAVSRLVPGMVGNPQSLAEESHSEAGLLEYPVYTRPADFRGIAVPEVLTSGNHQAVHRWRRDRSLERTAQRRPDMIAQLKATQLDKGDLEELARWGWFCAQDGEHVEKLVFRAARTDDVVALAEFARRTFVDACPPSIAERERENFIEKNLSAEQFSTYVADEDTYSVLLAEDSSAQIAGYMLYEHGDLTAQIAAGAPQGFVIDGVPFDGRFIYMSKAYVDQRWRSRYVFSTLFEFSVQSLRAKLGVDALLDKSGVDGDAGECSTHQDCESVSVPKPWCIWLGTHEHNRRAQKAYRKLGFVRAGKREFRVGDTINNDVTMVRPLNVAK